MSDLFVRGLMAGADTGNYRRGYQDGKEAATTAMRDALLSDRAVEAAVGAIESEVYAASQPGGRYSEEGLARAALTAALDAMTAGDTD